MSCKIILDVSSLFWQEKVHTALTKIQKKKSISLFYPYFMAWKNIKISKENVNIQSVDMSPRCQSKTNSCWYKQSYNLVYPCRRGFKKKWGRASKMAQLEKTLTTIPDHLSLRQLEHAPRRKKRTNCPSWPLPSTHTCPHILTHLHIQ